MGTSDSLPPAYAIPERRSSHEEGRPTRRDASPPPALRSARIEANAAIVATLARRIEIPVLMLNGRHDFIFPLELQKSFFRLLGTPAEHKRHVVFDGGHFGWPLGEFTRENLDWLDRYLGPTTQ
jgi:pimeloyl-ACP methyl ester carboxylesterase